MDISENCVNKIKNNLKKYNIPENIIIAELSDGLLCFNDKKYDFSELTDIIIAGMGGENIADIIYNIDEKENIENINFILQPNSKTEILRKFLYYNKFDIVDEIIVEDKHRIYNILQVKFTGEIYIPEMSEIVAGKNITHKGYITKVIRRLESILVDLDKKDDEKYNTETEFGYYNDIENLIAELERKKLW